VRTAHLIGAEKPGFSPNLWAATHLFAKNPVSDYPCVSPEKIQFLAIMLRLMQNI